MRRLLWIPVMAVVVVWLVVVSPAIVVIVAVDAVRNRRTRRSAPGLEVVASYQDWQNPFVGGVRSETLPGGEH